MKTALMPIHQYHSPAITPLSGSFYRAWQAHYNPATQRTVYGLQPQAGLKWTQLAPAWDAERLRTIRRAQWMSFSEITGLMAILAASLPEDEPGTIPIDVANLIRQAQQGDREAVASIYRVYVRRIYRYAACRVPSSSDAEDVTADVFVRMVEALPGYQITGAPFEAWLYRIAASRVADFYRNKANGGNEQLHENLADDAVPSEERLIEGQMLDNLRQAMQRLPDEHQTILVMRFVERKSHEEVAMLLGRSVTAVKTIQHRALSRLTEMLGSNHKVRHYLRGSHE